MNEEWRSIPDYEGYYEVSNLGRLRSLSRKVARTAPQSKNFMQYRTYGGKVLIPTKTKNKDETKAYYMVTLSKNCNCKKFLVHRLVLESFIKKCPEGMQACHNNGNSLDNRVENLRWDTPSNNQLDRFNHGTANWPVYIGSSHPRAKLTEDDVLQIRTTSKYFGRNVDLAKKYNLSESTVSSILNRQTWKHI